MKLHAACKKSDIANPIFSDKEGLGAASFLQAIILSAILLFIAVCFFYTAVIRPFNALIWFLCFAVPFVIFAFLLRATIRANSLGNSILINRKEIYIKDGYFRDFSVYSFDELNCVKIFIKRNGKFEASFFFEEGLTDATDNLAATLTPARQLSRAETVVNETINTDEASSRAEADAARQKNVKQERPRKRYRGNTVKFSFLLDDPRGLDALTALCNEKHIPITFLKTRDDDGTNEYIGNKSGIKPRRVVGACLLFALFLAGGSVMLAFDGISSARYSSSVYGTVTGFADAVTGGPLAKKPKDGPIKVCYSFASDGVTIEGTTEKAFADTTLAVGDRIKVRFDPMDAAKSHTVETGFSPMLLGGILLCFAGFAVFSLVFGGQTDILAGFGGGGFFLAAGVSSTVYFMISGLCFNLLYLIAAMPYLLFLLLLGFFGLYLIYYASKTLVRFIKVKRVKALRP